MASKQSCGYAERRDKKQTHTFIAQTLESRSETE